MANVFGIPITDATLEEMIEYKGKKITQKDRAHVALNMKNAEDKDFNARKFVDKLKADYGNGVSTLCVIYNATGDPVTFVTSHDNHGHLGSSPYPVEIANGQWGAFLHVKTAGAAVGSAGAVVYRGRNQNRDVCDWMLAWSNPWNRTYDSQAYTEIREANHYSGENAPWGDVFGETEKAGLTCTKTWNGCVSTVSIGNDTSPTYEGVMTLKDA